MGRTAHLNILHRDIWVVLFSFFFFNFPWKLYLSSAFHLRVCWIQALHYSCDKESDPCLYPGLFWRGNVKEPCCCSVAMFAVTFGANLQIANSSYRSPPVPCSPQRIFQISIPCSEGIVLMSISLNVACLYFSKVEPGRNKLFWNNCICCTHAGCHSVQVILAERFLLYWEVCSLKIT